MVPWFISDPHRRAPLTKPKITASAKNKRKLYSLVSSRLKGSGTVEQPRPGEQKQIMPKTVAVGVVTGDRTDKTRRVEIARLVRHPKYGKFVRRKTVCYVNDEKNESGVGDTVEIAECRPRSKTKRWELQQVVSKYTAVDIGAIRASRQESASD